MRIQMGQRNARLLSVLDLRVDLGGYFFGFGVAANVLGIVGQIPCRIAEAGACRLTGGSAPAIAGPLGVEVDLQPEIGIGMIARPADNFGKPGRGGQNACRGDLTFFQGRKAGLVNGVGHAEVLGFNDKKVSTFHMARRLSQDRLSVNWQWPRRTIEDKCGNRGYDQPNLKQPHHAARYPSTQRHIRRTTLLSLYKRVLRRGSSRYR